LYYSWEWLILQAKHTLAIPECPTDPGWTPLFINAKGIILEIGGALQHGAVVAREYGIPCVSGLDDATSILKDGQLVEVDGSNGIVRILETAEK